MKTHLDNGQPCHLEDLTSAFGHRMVTMSDLVELFAQREDTSLAVQTLAAVLSDLRDDWEVYEQAVREWYEREHPAADTEPKGTL